MRCRGVVAFVGVLDHEKKYGSENKVTLEKVTLEKVAGDPRGRGSGRKGGQGSGEQRRVTGKLLLRHSSRILTLRHFSPARALYGSWNKVAAEKFGSASYRKKRNVCRVEGGWKRSTWQLKPMSAEEMKERLLD